ncbi:MAG TPA: hypothetical protein PKY59_09205 [Pyrinomonadaceae bacterium]|nr:hypothetical protein [Pyrinomonadaceae bacterium]
MNNRKNYNSIFFLTVYLGLVLVGATPQVLAQAAMTRQFDIKNEIVVEDDLDKKPDDEKIDFAGTLESYYDQVEDFLKDLQKLHKIEKIDLDYDKFEVFESGFVPCNVDGDSVRHAEQQTRIDNRWLEAAVTDARDQFENYNFLSDCQQNGKFDNEPSTNSKLKLSYDKTELKLEISAPKLSKQRADFLAERFNQAYRIYEVDEENNFVKNIHQNTSFKSENNQVFIVTRLPRGSIDDLLKEKDAQ